MRGCWVELLGSSIILLLLAIDIACFSLACKFKPNPISSFTIIDYYYFTILFLLLTLLESLMKMVIVMIQSSEIMSLWIESGAWGRLREMRLGAER